MATTAEWGAFEWGEAEWGSIEEGDAPWSASGTLVLSGGAALDTDFSTLIAFGSLTLSGAGSITTLVSMSANGLLALLGSGSLRVARNATRLEDCGDPLSTTCQEGWMPGA